jgi:hypothetical protein
MTAANRSDFIKACDDYMARVRQYGDARAEQDKAFGLDPRPGARLSRKGRGMARRLHGRREAASGPVRAETASASMT